MCGELMRALLAAVGERLLGLDRERVRQRCLAALSRHTPSAVSTALAAGLNTPNAISDSIHSNLSAFDVSTTYELHYVRCHMTMT